MMTGDRVRLKGGASLCQQHPELAGAIGIVSSIVGQQTMHVRFAELNVVALNACADQFEPAGAVELSMPVRSTTRLRVI